MDKWQMAPDWAHWFTVGSNGAAYWWETKPELAAGRWWTLHGKACRAEAALEGGIINIERRPNPSLFDIRQEA